MGIGNIGWSEFLLIGIIVLVFFGPRRLPEIANAIGRSLREFRKALNEVRTEIQQAGLESEQDRYPSGRGEPDTPAIAAVRPATGTPTPRSTDADHSEPTGPEADREEDDAETRDPDKPSG